MLGCLLLRRRLALGQWYVGRVIALVVGVGGDHRRVRSQKHAVHEPVFFAVLSQPGQHLISHEIGVTVRRLEPCRYEPVAAIGRRQYTGHGLVDILPTLEDIALGMQVFHPGRHEVGKQQADLVACQRALIGAQGGVTRIAPTRVGAGVGITKKYRVKPQFAHLLGQIRMALVQRCAVAPDPVVHQVEASVQARARRTTRRGDREMLLEQHPIGCQRVQVRCFEHSVPQRREALATPLICRNEQNFSRAAHGLVGSATAMHSSSKRSAGDRQPVMVVRAG